MELIYKDYIKDKIDKGVIAGDYDIINLCNNTMYDKTDEEDLKDFDLITVEIFKQIRDLFNRIDIKIGLRQSFDIMYKISDNIKSYSDIFLEKKSDAECWWLIISKWVYDC